MSFGPSQWNFDDTRAVVTEDGGVGTKIGECFAASLKHPMPPNTGTYVYNVVITDLGADSQIGVVTEDFSDWSTTWPWGRTGLYTWCDCGHLWNHGLGPAGMHGMKYLCSNKQNSHIEISVHVDTDSSPPAYYWDMPTPNTPENDCQSGQTGELLVNLPAGKTFFFELGGCGQHNSYRLESASGQGIGIVFIFYVKHITFLRSSVTFNNYQQ